MKEKAMTSEKAGRKPKPYWARIVLKGQLYDVESSEVKDLASETMSEDLVGKKVMIGTVYGKVQGVAESVEKLERLLGPLVVEKQPDALLVHSKRVQKKNKMLEIFVTPADAKKAKMSQVEEKTKKKQAKDEAPAALAGKSTDEDNLYLFKSMQASQGKLTLSEMEAKMQEMNKKLEAQQTQIELQQKLLDGNKRKDVTLPPDDEEVDSEETQFSGKCRII